MLRSPRRVRHQQAGRAEAALGSEQHGNPGSRALVRDQPTAESVAGPDLRGRRVDDRDLVAAVRRACDRNDALGGRPLDKDRASSTQLDDPLRASPLEVDHADSGAAIEVAADRELAAVWRARAGEGLTKAGHPARGGPESERVEQPQPLGAVGAVDRDQRGRPLGFAGRERRRYGDHRDQGKQQSRTHATYTVRGRR